MRKLLYATTLALLANFAFAQSVLYQENFESGNSMDLNVATVVDGNSTGTDCNSFYVNNVFQGGTFLLYGLFPVTISDTPDQPSGITNFPNSNYLHITSDLASSNGIENANFQAVDGMLCATEGWHFATTPDISTTGYSNVTLNFWYLNNGSANSRAAVYYSLDNGNSWLPLSADYYGVTDWTSESLTDASLDNQPNLRFGFLFVSSSDGDDSPFSVDEITVTGTPAAVCPTAINLSTRDIGTTAATLDWDYPNGTLTPDSVYVYFQVNGTSQWYRRKWTDVDSIRIYNLVENTTYRWRMRVFCGGTAMPDVYGQNFTTTFVCKPVKGVQVSNITPTTATISWTNFSAADSAYVRYRKAGGLWLLGRTNSNTLNLTGLKPNSSYEYTIRQFCQNQISLWTQTATFSTSNSKTENTEVAVLAYPNPAHDFLTVQFNSNGVYQIQLLDLIGHEHLSWAGNEIGLQSLGLDISTVPAGVYFLQINNGTEKLTQRIAKY